MPIHKARVTIVFEYPMDTEDYGDLTDPKAMMTLDKEHIESGEIDLLDIVNWDSQIVDIQWEVVK